MAREDQIGFKKQKRTGGDKKPQKRWTDKRLDAQFTKIDHHFETINNGMTDIKQILLEFIENDFKPLVIEVDNQGKLLRKVIKLNKLKTK